jgi:predicted transcriptional regulator
MKRDPSFDALLELEGRVYPPRERNSAMKTLKIGIASYKDMKARTMAIARGKLKPKPGDPKVWFTSTESFARVLSNKNRALLATIAATHPGSLQELAGQTGRKASNLSRTLKTMEHYGFVRLHRGERGRVRPEVPYESISLELPFTA